MGSKPSWVEFDFGPAPSEAPGADAPCGCLAPLALAGHFPEGPFELGTDPQSMFFGAVTLARSGTYTYQVGWCPACGGRLGRYRPELVAAHARFREAAAGLAGVDDLRTIDAVEAFCATRGITEVLDESDYHRTWVDRGASLQVSSGWDPDHERAYTRCRFFPGAALIADPYAET